MDRRGCSIAGRVDSSFYRSECLFDSVAMQVEQIISDDGDVSELLDKFFCSDIIEDINKRSDGSCFGAYAAYYGELYINDFEQHFKAAAGQQSTDMVSRTAPHARILVVNDNETNPLVAKSLLNAQW
ncbi:MAG: hypothetical protein PUI48_06730 [Oscillospiraceae bacterium]|nr:hypothetical protein [Oscillospiraceae bacterium]MDY6207851.1 hypothetical protein [Oscillospiraceae bacterium]